MLADSFTPLPVLTQWVVYAIRNLTEDNSQNQDLIAKMEQQGLADASLLKKMGLEVEKRGDRLILKSTRDTPPQVSMPWEQPVCAKQPPPPVPLPTGRASSREPGWERVAFSDGQESPQFNRK